MCHVSFGEQTKPPASASANKSSIIRCRDRKREGTVAVSRRGVIKLRQAKINFASNCNRFECVRAWTRPSTPASRRVASGDCRRDGVATSCQSCSLSRCSMPIRYHGNLVSPFNFRFNYYREIAEDGHRYRDTLRAAGFFIIRATSKKQRNYEAAAARVYRPNGQIYAYGFHSF